MRFWLLRGPIYASLFLGQLAVETCKVKIIRMNVEQGCNEAVFIQNVVPGTMKDWIRNFLYVTPKRKCIHEYQCCFVAN